MPQHAPIPPPVRFSSRLFRAAHGLRDFVYPPICPLCVAPVSPQESICFRCRAAMTSTFEWRCDRCGGAGFGAEPEPGKPCKLCPPPGAAWQGVLAATPYRDRATRCVLRFKYSRRTEMGEAIASLMIDALREPIAELGARLDLVAPVPLHWRRHIYRGFNQSELLSSQLAAACSLPTDPRLLRRVRNTTRQALLPRERRATNVAGAFAVRDGSAPAIRDRGILLIDDVVTTGHTIQECARVLREAGAREVWIACFARAGLGLPDDHEHLLG